MQQRVPITAAATSGFDPASFVRSICNYASQKTKLQDFFLNYEDNDHHGGKGKRGAKIKKGPKKYLQSLQNLSNTDSVIEVAVDDVLDHFGYDKSGSGPNLKADDVINTLLTNVPRATRLIYETLEIIRKEHFSSAVDGSVASLREKVRSKICQIQSLPSAFRVDFEVRLVPPSQPEPFAIHTLRACHVGSLIKVAGTVSKVTGVKPCLIVAVYRCLNCGAYEFQQVESASFSPLKDCQSSACRTARHRNTLTLSIRDSKFVRRQEARLQELPHAVPPGAVPRQLKLILFRDLTRRLKPGMTVTVGGVYLPQASTPNFARSRVNQKQTVLEVQWINLHRSTEELLKKKTAREEIDFLLRDSTPKDLYARMSASIAPAIHGHADVKKVLLLQLIGGASERFNDGLKIRGDIHVLLMGDPGIAKSQLLLRVSAVAPRAHFTCGKGSSGVGLTASVVKDPLTGEFALEGGAIVMADEGVCCVDEFDKMQESDRTAIHEVMEQQTVSISKAGLNATLNARTTILAAANPIMGRYDISQTVASNINLPAALISRFDVIFLLLDEGGIFSKDLQMARHILKIHREQKVTAMGPNDEYSPLSAEVLRALIAKAQEYRPKLSPALAEEICQHYVELRAEDRNRVGEDNAYVTPRTLFGLLRMSQALARLRFTNEIERGDFEEAVRLMRASQESVKSRNKSDHIERDQSLLLNLLQKISQDCDDWIPFKKALAVIEAEGLSGKDLEDTIDNLTATGMAKWDSVKKNKFQLLHN